MLNRTCLFVLAFLTALPLSAEDPTRRALLVAINKYKFNNVLPDLNGCVNDLHILKSLLVSKFGFRDENVVTLTDDDATRQHIIDAFKTHLIAKSGPDDLVLFYYAGHGSRIANPAEPSGWDQTMVPQDSRDPEGKVFDISDRELHVLFADLLAKTSNITAIMDSCYSGTAVRGAKVRSAPADRRQRPANTYLAGVRTRGATTIAPQDARIVFIAGARSDQLSFEHSADDGDHGAMTYFLLKELSRSGSDTTWRDVMDRVATMVTARYPPQSPQLETAGRDTLVFGGAAATPEPYVLASPVGKTQTTLNAGAVQGLTAGSEYAIYPPGTRDFSGKPLATAKLSRVMDFAATGDLAEGGPVPEGARAVERVHQYPDFKLRVMYDGNSGTLKRVRDAVQRETWAETVDKMSKANLRVAESSNGIQIYRADGSPVSDPVPSKAADAPQQVSRKLAKWAKWFNLLALDNSATASSAITISVLPENAGSELKDGGRFTIKVCNNGEKPYFVGVLDLSSVGSVDTFPMHKAGSAQQVAPRNCATSEALEAYVPDGNTKVTDVFKVIATPVAIDLAALTGPAIRAGVDTTNPLAALLANAAFGTTRGAREVPVSDWSTASQAVVISKQ